MQLIIDPLIGTDNVILEYGDFGRIAAFIDTPRVLISSYKDENFDDYCQLFSDARLMLYYDDGIPKSSLEVQKMLRKSEKSGFPIGNPFGFFSLFEKGSKEFMGVLDCLSTNCDGVFEIGVVLSRKYQGRGFVEEVLDTFLGEYLEFLNRSRGGWPTVETVIATAHPCNVASRRLIEKFGFQYQYTRPRFGHPRLWYSLMISTGDSLSFHGQPIPKELCLN